MEDDMVTFRIRQMSADIGFMQGLTQEVFAAFKSRGLSLEDSWCTVAGWLLALEDKMDKRQRLECLGMLDTMRNPNNS